LITPWKTKYLRVGMTEHFDGGRCGHHLSWSGQDRGDWNQRISHSRLDNMERRAAIALGEIYPEWGI